jgi:hypothetical protein
LDRLSPGRLDLSGTGLAFGRGSRAGLLDSPGMKLTGDPDGLAALKSFQEGNRDYLKFLIQEATSVFEHHVDFKGPDGTPFRLIHDQKTGEFRVEKKVG